MKKDNTNEESDVLAEMPEWTDDDWSKAKPNRFADQFDHTLTVVLLDPDVAAVFTTPAAVNKVLRALIEAMPTQTITRRARKATPSRPDNMSAAAK